MKAAQKKQLDSIIAAAADVIGTLEACAQAASDLHQEISDDYEGRTDKWKEGEAGEKAQGEVDAVEQIATTLQDAVDALSNLESMADEAAA